MALLIIVLAWIWAIWAAVILTILGVLFLIFAFVDRPCTVVRTEGKPLPVKVIDIPEKDEIRVQAAKPAPKRKKAKKSRKKVLSKK
ncbi:MAG: hypothetical protein V1659_03970 [Candidatus Woesearchaeota archaeon]